MKILHQEVAGLSNMLTWVLVTYIHCSLELEIKYKLSLEEIGNVISMYLRQRDCLTHSSIEYSIM